VKGPVIPFHTALDSIELQCKEYLEAAAIATQQMLTRTMQSVQASSSTMLSECQHSLQTEQRARMEWQAKAEQMESALKSASTQQQESAKSASVQAESVVERVSGSETEAVKSESASFPPSSSPEAAPSESPSAAAAAAAAASSSAAAAARRRTSRVLDALKDNTQINLLKKQTTEQAAQLEAAVAAVEEWRAKYVESQAELQQLRALTEAKLQQEVGETMSEDTASTTTVTPRERAPSRHGGGGGRAAQPVILSDEVDAAGQGPTSALT
jgi:hypothetical protein